MDERSSQYAETIRAWVPGGDLPRDMARLQTLAVGLEVPAAVARSGVSMSLSYEPFASSGQRLGFPGRFR